MLFISRRLNQLRRNTMPEYTWDDIIINPNTEEAKNCIGKEVYYSDNPTLCLSYANSNNSGYIKILGRIELDNLYPFVMNDNGSHWGSIILCKEDTEPEYVPFYTIEEFVKASLIHNKDHYLSGTGIWVKEPYDDDDAPVCTTMVDSLRVSDNTIFVDGIWLSLKEVLDSYRFLDDTPCGKIKE